MASMRSITILARRLRLPALALVAALGAAGAAHGKMSVLDSPHNLSASGGRGRTSGLPGVTFAGETQVCVFCHVPHNAISGTPLWSRSLPPDTTPYQPYNQSSTLNASPKPDKPTGASRLCLSCHDGTLALSKYVGSHLSDQTYMPYDQIAGASGALNATVNAKLGTDLRDDHPISFQYTDTLALASHLVSPSNLPPQIRLEKGINLECTACHDPHDNEFGNFLVMNNGSDNPASPNYMTGSPLCVACHQPAGWSATTHNNTKDPTLGHQCLSCHSVHSAPGPVRLLSWANMEDNCLASCHNGSATATTSVNVKPLFDPTTLYRHPVNVHNPNPLLDHDEKESLPVAASHYHVQCVDCHNPHQVNGTNAPLSNPPNIDGRLAGVRVDAAGNYAQTEFDVCFKCHSGPSAAQFSGQTEPMPNRMIPEPDQQQRFNTANPSYHPVTGVSKIGSASLLSNLQPMPRIYCSDCHNSDQSTKAGGIGPNGPHGSNFVHILMARYYMPLGSTDPSTRESYSSALYAVCFRCHSENYIISNGSAFSTGVTNHHFSHVVTRRIPCFACHDPHGVPISNPKVTAVNNAHLINFDRDYAASDTFTNPYYATTSPGNGTCVVVCHQAPGNSESYGPISGVLKMRRGLVFPRLR
ncbi:hypothetical protein L4X63_00015 [Geomonas sp. Red32]|uniref:cytochrome c3 family protein n=1 Tax=Geomonas sp. Red32 TaxID=2912856 RepID=UPI00202CD24B|nr:cytochrome c3 family protein [Geomonas sp. Red32]MCM0079965.1 hypothetical protein [Geomonas sp. Red32]